MLLYMSISIYLKNTERSMEENLGEEESNELRKLE